MELIFTTREPDVLSKIQRPVENLVDLEERVAFVLREVRRRGDAAIREFTRQFDRMELEDFRATPAELEAAAGQLSDRFKEALATAERNIRLFHQTQWRANGQEVETTAGITCWRQAVPIEKIGIYIPGGSAPLFSTVLMLGVPASIAGCPNVYLFTPPRKDGTIHPAILYAAQLTGITNIFKIGGAQAIAAMAFGTESVPKVDKIFGPGNAFVTEAKRQVAALGVSIDMPAGPSEVFIVADENAPAEFVAADLLAQAEHSEESQVILATPSESLARRTIAEVRLQMRDLPRKTIIEKSMEKSAFIVTRSLDEALDLANAYAPEHLILMVERPRKLVERVRNAGSVFLGNYTPEALGDYASGTNHVLPTYGYTRAYSGISVDDFVKWIYFQKATEEGILNLGPVVEELAREEKLEAHVRSIAIRLKKLKRRKRK